MIPATRREYLFLQGLAGPFFHHLGLALGAAGHGVHRVNFHGGDLLFWRQKGGVNYRGRAADWPEYLERLLQDRGITDLVLFGDCRPMHRAAIAAAERLQVGVHVFEEGYIRPDWVTLEEGGVNGHSALPRNLDYYLDAARTLPPPDAPLDALPAVPTSFRRRAVEDLQYNIAGMLLGWYFRHYETHRPWHPLVEYAGWGRRLLGRAAARRRAAKVFDALQADGRPFFVFPLQLDCDYQVRLHSPFRALQPAIEQVLASFATHAPDDVLLAVKAHPLDNGLTDWRRRTQETAARHGVADRVVFLEEGDMTTIARLSRGMVTINSTSGTLALAQGVPVIVLGDAVYNVPGLTHGGTLDEFWTDPAPARPGAYEAFRRVLVHRCLIRGGYFSDEGLRLLVDAAAARLTRAQARVRSAVAAPRDAQGVAAAERADRHPMAGAARG